MLEPQELRIGNYIQAVDGDFGKVNALAKTYIQLENRQTFTYEDVFALPITEEWLLKFGFKKAKESMYINGVKYILQIYDNTRLEAISNLDGSLAVLCICNGNYFANNKKHVHQLQNLFFGLYGEELPGTHSIT